MNKFRKSAALVLVAAMLLSLCGLGAFAAGEDEPGAPGEEAPGEGAPPGGMPGQSSTPIDLTGMLALSQYVFTDGEVAADYYGLYKAGGDGEASFVVDADAAADIAVYLDEALQEPAADVTASVDGGKFTATGVNTEENTVYYLSTGGAYTTIIYVVNDTYDQNTAKLTLADGTTMDLTTYAPNMASGDYKALVGDNAINGETSVYIGANRSLVSLSDFGDKENYAANEAAAAWYLQSGITNSGASLTAFGDTLYGFEYEMGIYRLFQIVIDEMVSVNGFEYPTDYKSGMMMNDQYSDGVEATMNAGVWNGIYTKYSADKKSASASEDDGYDGFYLLENIDGETRELGLTVPVTTKFAYVAIYNAYSSNWTMLSESGKAMAEKLEKAAAAYDRKTKTAPEDYTNEAKISAVATELLGQDGAAAVAAADEKLDKIDAVAVLYAARNDVKSKESPDTAWAEKTDSGYSDMTAFFPRIYGENATVEAGKSYISDEDTALLVNNAGAVTFQNNTFGVRAVSDAVTKRVMTIDPDTMVDGAEAAMGTQEEGFIYNATMRNAYYRDAVGSGIAFWGKDTHAVLTSDNGALVLDGVGGTMAGTAYVGFGASVQIKNGVVYSESQHPTNNLYNGTIHYLDAYAIGSGRLYSSDFWGGYQVYENSIGQANGHFVDEPTTLIVKNSVYDTTVGGTGYSSQYFENSILHVGTATYNNHTSIITDTAGLTLVNSVMNSTGDSLINTTECEDVVVKLVDSDITLAGNVLASLNNVVNNPREVIDNFASEVVFKLYGENTIQTSDGTLKAEVPEGSAVTIYGSVVDENGEAVEIAGATILPGEGTLVVSAASAGAYYESALDWAEETGVIDAPVDASAVTTRGTFVEWLWKAAGSPAASAEIPFTDVAADASFYNAVVWAYANKITVGTGDMTYSPELPLTRAQVVTFLWRYAGEQNAAPAGFGDVAAETWFENAVNWGAANGIVLGYDANTFAPFDPCLTVQTLTYLYRELVESAYEGEPYANMQKASIVSMDEAEAKNTALTLGAAAQMIAALYQDSGVEGFGADVTTEEAALAAVTGAGYYDGDKTAADEISGAEFLGILASALHTDALDAAAEGPYTVYDAAVAIDENVLVLRNGMTYAGDTNRFIAIDPASGSKWTVSRASGELHIAGIIGYGSIAGINAYGTSDIEKYDLASKQFKGVTIYYNAYAGSANCVMPSDPNSFEMCYVSGGGRLYPDYPKSLITAGNAGNVYTGTEADKTLTVGTADAPAENKVASYTADGSTVIDGYSITAATSLSAPDVTRNMNTYGSGDAVYAATSGAAVELKNSSVTSLKGRGVVAIAGAAVNISDSVIDNQAGTGAHGTCVLYGSVLDVKDTKITSNTSALSSDFGGGLILADNVEAKAIERGAGILADGMTFGYVTNSRLVTEKDAGATTAGCGFLDIRDSYIEGNDKGILYSYVFGMLASNRSYINITACELAGNDDAIYIQGNTVDINISDSTIAFDSDESGDYLIYAENPTVPAPFYTRANVTFAGTEVAGDIYFNDDTSSPCVVGYTDHYLNIYIGENASWTGKVISTGNDGGVHIFKLVNGAYEEVSYELDTELTVSTK